MEQKKEIALSVEEPTVTSGNDSYSEGDDDEETRAMDNSGARGNISFSPTLPLRELFTCPHCQEMYQGFNVSRYCSKLIITC